MGRVEEASPSREWRVVMSGGKTWEVCLYSDFSDYQVWCKNFRSLRQARRFMRKVLRKNNTFYCATISNEETSSFQTFYWNGRNIFFWDKPWVLSRRQAFKLEVDESGNIEPKRQKG
jgi:hypothetical protein